LLPSFAPLPFAAKNYCAKFAANMAEAQPNNPLHGVTLEMMLNELVARHGWAELGRMINIRCFNCNPGVRSSLAFLRKTPWARKKVEELYLRRKPPGTEHKRPSGRSREKH
jgi:uncharacterized protein (DUF2132 family)